MSGSGQTSVTSTGRLTTGFLNQPSNELCLVFGAIGNMKLASSNFKSASTNQIQPRQRLDELVLQSPLAEPLGQYPLPSDQGLLKVPCENEDCSPSTRTTRVESLKRWTPTESPETVLWQGHCICSASNFCCRALLPSDKRTSQTSRSSPTTQPLGNFVPHP